MADTQRALRKRRTGIVTSDKMEKTVIVKVSRSYMHPLYKRVIGSRRKFSVHDEANECRVGDRVRIQETRPLSKTKRWRVIEIIEKAK